MIDLDKYKTWQRNRPSKTLIETTAIYHHDFDELIQALSEAKEIIEYFNECPYDLDKASIPKSGNLDLDQVVGNMSVARKKEQLLGQWLTRYFPDTRKEEV